MMLCLWMEGDGENSHFLARLDHSNVFQENLLKVFEIYQKPTLSNLRLKLENTFR